MTEQDNFLKIILIPAAIFYIIDIVVIHEGTKDIIFSKIPCIETIFNALYDTLSKIIFHDHHSQAGAHTIIFMSLLVLMYNIFNISCNCSTLNYKNDNVRYI